MAKFDDKVNGNTVDADEYNNIVRASKNAIEDSGQTIDSTNTQLSEAIANYVGSGSFYTDSGAANAYVVSPIGSFRSPESYQDGMIVRFRAGNASTTASTINVNGLGVKNIKLEDGSTDVTTEITTDKDTFLRFDFANDVFQVLQLVSPRSSTTAFGRSLLPDTVTIANGTDSDHDIDFSGGNFNFDDGSGQYIVSALTKQIDANWAVGDNAGGLDTGTVAADTTYHCFAIYDSTNIVSDYIFSLSATSPTLPGTYDKKRRVGSVITDGSANILNFVQDGKRFYFESPVSDFSQTTLPTAVQTITMTTPIGIVTTPIMNVFFGSATLGSSTRTIIFTEVGQPDLAPSGSLFDIRVDQGSNEIEGTTTLVNSTRTDTSSQIRYRVSTTGISMTIMTRGWTDNNL